MDDGRVKSRTVIPHGDKNTACGIQGRADSQLSPSIIERVHCFDRIEDQVQNDLLQLNALAFDERQARVEVGLQGNAMPEQFGPDDSESSVNKRD